MHTSACGVAVIAVGNELGYPSSNPTEFQSANTFGKSINSAILPAPSMGK